MELDRLAQTTDTTLTICVVSCIAALVTMRSDTHKGLSTALYHIGEISFYIAMLLALTLATTIAANFD